MKTRTSHPLVSIYITTRNRLKLLKRAIDSARNQTYQNIEILVVDDASTDGTREYLSEVSHLDKRIHVICNDMNLGACIGRNRAIQSAQGVFVTGLDDDDFFDTYRISTFVEKWNKKGKNTIALFSNAKIVSEANRITTTRRKKIVRAEDIIESNYIGNQIFVEKFTLLVHGGFDEELPAWQDLECWYRVLKQSGCNAALVDDSTYTIDISHSHERISSQKIDKIEFACQYIATKHSLSKSEAEILELQLCHYDNRRPSLIAVVKKLIRRPGIRPIKHSFVAYFNYIFKDSPRKIYSP